MTSITKTFMGVASQVAIKPSEKSLPAKFGAGETAKDLRGEA
jgi:hypothetical protein